MKRIYHSAEIRKFKEEIDNEKRTIGFVPTMGALHQGHLTLIKKAREENDVVICSIFINPLQFNNKKDFDSYPSVLDEDLILLEKEQCDIVFLPQKDDLYGENPTLQFDFGTLGLVMEGKSRPGHFNGMAAVVKRFFEIIRPTKAYFGEKDFQQLAIVRWLNARFNLNVKIIGCRTIREKNGLALSSRNLLLSEQEQLSASLLYSTLKFSKENYKKICPIELVEKCGTILSEKFQVDYFTIADETKLSPLTNWEESTKPRAFVAAHLGSVRLIDNLALID